MFIVSNLNNTGITKPAKNIRLKFDKYSATPSRWSLFNLIENIEFNPNIEYRFRLWTIVYKW